MSMVVSQAQSQRRFDSVSRRARARYFAASIAMLGMLTGCRQAMSVFAPTPIAESEGFRIAVIPDTQCYTSGGGGQQPGACGGPLAQITNEMFLAQARFIAGEAGSLRIAAVAGTGDIVNCGDALSEWENARRGYDIIEAAAIPYAAAIGNHDYDGWCINGSTSRTVNYNAYFGIARLGGYGWFVDQFPAGSTQNLAVRFTPGGGRYLIVTLEHNPSDAAIEWARQLVGSNPAEQVFVVVNEFLHPSGERTAFGQRIWDRLVSPSGNVVMVLDSLGRTSRRSDITLTGNLVPQISQGFQFEEAGGGGYMRLLHVQPSRGQIEVLTYSPYLRRSHPGAANHFTVAYGPVEAQSDNGTPFPPLN